MEVNLTRYLAISCAFRTGVAAEPDRRLPVHEADVEVVDVVGRGMDGEHEVADCLEPEAPPLVGPRRRLSLRAGVVSTPDRQHDLDARHGLVRLEEDAGHGGRPGLHMGRRVAAAEEDPGDTLRSMTPGRARLTYASTIAFRASRWRVSQPAS